MVNKNEDTKKHEVSKTRKGGNATEKEGKPSKNVLKTVENSSQTEKGIYDDEDDYYEENYYKDEENAHKNDENSYKNGENTPENEENASKTVEKTTQTNINNYDDEQYYYEVEYYEDEEDASEKEKIGTKTGVSNIPIENQSENAADYEKSTLLVENDSPRRENTNVDVENQVENTDPPKSNIILMCFNFVNSLVGIAVTGIPYALKETGFGLGILFLIIFAILSKYSLEILIEAGRAAHVKTYQDLVRSQYGNWAYYYLTFIQLLYPFILLIVYNLLIGDSFLETLDDGLILYDTDLHKYRPLVILLCNVCVCLPISLLYEIRRLSEVSLLSIIFVVVMVVIVVAEVAMKPHISQTKHAYRLVDVGIIQALGIIAVAFICHHNAFLLYDQLENPTLEHWNAAASVSTFISFGIMTLFGIAGYIKFTGHSHSNIFKNFCDDDEWADFAKVCFAVNLMLTYPIQMFVARNVVENTLFYEKERTVLRHVTITLIIGMAAYAISTVTACLKFILQLTGVFGGFPLAYVIPAALYMKTKQQKQITKENLHVVLIGFVGMIITVVGTIKIILDIVDEDSCSDTITLTYCVSN